MEGIRLIGFSICITTVVTSIFSMLTPDSKLDKVLRFAISLFFLTSLVSPFVNNKLDFHIELSDLTDPPQTRTLTQSVESQFASLAETKLENLAENVLLRENISPKKVEATIHISEDGSVSISKMVVSIETKDSGKQAAIQELIQEQFGCLPEIAVYD